MLGGIINNPNENEKIKKRNKFRIIAVNSLLLNVDFEVS
jgi:hypothetical protein